jgi:hypothetical protein
MSAKPAAVHIVHDIGFSTQSPSAEIVKNLRAKVWLPVNNRVPEQWFLKQRVAAVL